MQLGCGLNCPLSPVVQGPIAHMYTALNLYGISKPCVCKVLKKGHLTLTPVVLGLSRAHQKHVKYSYGIPTLALVVKQKY